jgi:hypothetical protein
MGRLALNMLLSFAQFEREVTGERIRDKIAASKKKSMWMGGFVPLGCAPKNGTASGCWPNTNAIACHRPISCPIPTTSCLMQCPVRLLFSLKPDPNWS